MSGEEPANPILVDVWRGDSVESRHRGRAVVVDRAGTLRAAWGDAGAPLFPRSAVKPLQALPLVASGAAARFGLGPREIALASGSHGGDAQAVATVRRWLARLGCGADSLICGPQPPLSETAAQRLAAAGHPPGRLHHNCSGKHAGFISVALSLGVPIVGYGDPDHPVQQRVIATLARFTDLAPAALLPAVDGCGVPTFALPLAALALAFARLGSGAGPRPFDPASGTVLAAMTAHPRNVAGPGRLDTEIIAAGRGRVIVKGGAEGVAAAALPDAGLGLAVKIDDGAKRAAEAAIAALLGRWLPAGDPLQPLLQRWSVRPLLNSAGRPVGRIEARAIAR